MRISKTEQRTFLLCVSNEDNPASLELWKLYRAMPDETAARLGCVRVIDESGKDYLYPSGCFVSLRLPASVIPAEAGIHRSPAQADHSREGLLTLRPPHVGRMNAVGGNPPEPTASASFPRRRESTRAPRNRPTGQELKIAESVEVPLGASRET